MKSQKRYSPRGVHLDTQWVDMHLVFTRNVRNLNCHFFAHKIHSHVDVHDPVLQCSGHHHIGMEERERMCRSAQRQMWNRVVQQLLKVR